MPPIIAFRPCAAPRPLAAAAVLAVAATARAVLLLVVLLLAAQPATAQPATSADDPTRASGARPAAERTALVHATITEQAGLGQAESPSFGVPLARGAVREPSELRAWIAATGQSLPAQARALSRWPDGSLRWALLDTRLALGPKQSVRIAAGLAADIAPGPSPWVLVAPDGTRHPLGAPSPGEPGLAATGLEPVAELLDGGEASRVAGWSLDDGVTSWPLLGSGPGGASVLGLRARLVDRFGHVYEGLLRPGSLRLLEAGPLRLAFEVRGEHRAAPGAAADALPIAFHAFTARVHLLAGRGAARVEWSLENGPLHDPPGALAFRSYELLADPGSGPLQLDAPGTLQRGDVGVALRHDGPTPGTMSFRVGEEQYRPARTDDLWIGFVEASQPERSLHVQLADSALQHPKALLRGPGGPLRIGLLPPGAGEEFWLDDATRKTFRLTLARDLGGSARGAMLALSRPAHAAIDPGDVAASGAWGDAGLVYVPDAAQLAAPVERPKDPPTGWADWGEWRTRNTRVSGSPRNRLSVFLEAVQSGRREPWELALARARHAMDLRPFHIEGFTAAEFPRANLNEGVPHGNEPPENRLGRTGMEARFPEHKAGIPAKGHGYNGFDPEHMTLDDVYELWLLTGDWGALDALRSAGEAMLTWRYVLPEGRLHSARVLGWTLRALVQCARATGEPRYLDAAAGMVARADAQRGRGDVPYLIRMKADARHIADAESEAPWMVAVALHGLCAYHAETGDPLVPPMLADATRFVMAAWRGNGFVPDLPVEGPLDGGLATQPLGTSQWIPGALAAAAFVTGDHAPVDRVYPYYRMLAKHPDAPIAFGSDDWHWWQPYLLSLERRHGAAAVRAPEGFTPPPAGGR